MRLSIFISCAMCIVLLVQCCVSQLAEIQVGPVTVEQPGRRAQYRLLSKESGLHLSVLRSGRLHAHAARPNRNSRFFLTNEGPENAITLESVKFRGRFLVMDEQRDKLRLDYPHNGNERFEVVQIDRSVFIALRAFNGYYVSFDKFGEAMSLRTNQTIHNTSTHVRLEPYILDD